jgi:hypothetical protein
MLRPETAATHPDGRALACAADQPEALNGLQTQDHGHPDPSTAAAPSLLDELRSLGLVGQMWTISVVVFCVARAVVVWPVLRDHGVNPWWFLALDAGTAPFYGVGQAMGVKVMRDVRRPMRDAVPWIAMLFVSFVAPYAYLLLSAGKLPSYVVAGVVAWMAVFGVLAAIRMAREVRCGRDEACDAGLVTDGPVAAVALAD